VTRLERFTIALSIGTDIVVANSGAWRLIFVNSGLAANVKYRATGFCFDTTCTDVNDITLLLVRFALH
jgi:hypothetical protein